MSFLCVCQSFIQNVVALEILQMIISFRLSIFYQMFVKLLVLTLLAHFALSEILNIQTQGTNQATVLPHYDYIIVGAGIAGIGASKVFTAQGSKHLLLEAKDRIGGRIGKGTFSGITIDVGANFIHFPEKNYLNTVVDKIGIGKVPANFHIQSVFYTNQSTYSTADLALASSAYSDVSSFIKTTKNSLQSDVPISNVLNNFWSQNTNYSNPIKDRVNQQYQIQGVQSGADLTEMSTFQFSSGSKKGSGDSTDYIPAGGWNLLLQTIFNQWCTPELHLNEVVTSVDYSGDKINVKTSKASYTTNNLLVGVPLGALKANTINFSPPLPADKQQAIDAIGFGKFQKLFVAFDAAFWPAGSSTLHFVGQGKFARYVQGWVVPNTLGLNVVVFFISGQDARTLVSWSDDQIKTDLLAFLSSYTNQTLSISNLYMSRWANEPYTFGSYSYATVGTKKAHFQALKTVITNNNNRIWLIGEHTDPSEYSYTQGAYQSGESAAYKAIVKPQ